MEFNDLKICFNFITSLNFNYTLTFINTIKDFKYNIITSTFTIIKSFTN